MKLSRLINQSIIPKNHVFNRLDNFEHHLISCSNISLINILIKLERARRKNQICSQELISG